MAAWSSPQQSWCDTEATLQPLLGVRTDSIEKQSRCRFDESQLPIAGWPGLLLFLHATLNATSSTAHLVPQSRGKGRCPGRGSFTGKRLRRDAVAPRSSVGGDLTLACLNRLNPPASIGKPPGPAGGHLGRDLTVHSARFKAHIVSTAGSARPRGPLWGGLGPDAPGTRPCPASISSFLFHHMGMTATRRVDVRDSLPSASSAAELAVSISEEAWCDFGFLPSGVETFRAVLKFLALATFHRCPVRWRGLWPRVRPHLKPSMALLLRRWVWP